MQLRNFSDEQYEAWRVRMGIIMEKLGRANEAEDALNEFCAGALEGKHQHQTLDQFAIDYLRKRSGRKGSRGYLERQELQRAASIEQTVLGNQLGIDSRRDVDARLDLERVRDSLKEPRDKLIFQLYHIEGFTMKEIGEELDLSEARVDQLLSKSEREVAKRLMTGMSNQQIGDQLFVTEKTVKFHITNIYQKTGARSRADFMANYGHVVGSSIEAPTIKGDYEMSNWEPMTPKPLQPLPGVPVASVAKASAQDGVNFIVETFKVDETIKDLQTMAKEVTKGDYSVDKVMAACQCIGRMNETIQTVMKAAQVINERR